MEGQDGEQPKNCLRSLGTAGVLLTTIINVSVPSELRYTTDHEWVLSAPDGLDAVVRMGLTEYASEALGDVVFVELPEVGAKVSASDSVGEVESTKSVSDVYAPLSGTVTKVNSLVVSDPSLVNADPYGKGWLLEISVDEGADWSNLLDASAYEDLTGE